MTHSRGRDERDDEEHERDQDTERMDLVEDRLLTLSRGAREANLSPQGTETIGTDDDKSQVHEERIDSAVLSIVFPCRHLRDTVEGILCGEVLGVEEEEHVSEVEVGEGQEPLGGVTQEGEWVLSSPNELRLVEIEGGVGRDRRRGRRRGGVGDERRDERKGRRERSREE
jgi:hypothetical protein